MKTKGINAKRVQRTIVNDEKGSKEVVKKVPITLWVNPAIPDDHYMIRYETC